MIKISVLLFLFVSLSLSQEIKVSKVNYKFILDESKPNSTFFSISSPLVQNLDKKLLQEIYKNLDFQISEKDEVNTNYILKNIINKFDEFDSNYKNLLEELKTDDPELANRLIYTYDEAYQFKHFKDFISLSRNITYYTGGAHSNYSTLHFNYSLKDKKRIVLKDIISNNDSLMKKAEEKFRTLYKIPQNVSINTTGFQFPDGIFTLTENYLIEKDGISFLWNTYEVAAYAYGQITLKLTYTELEGILNKKYTF
jgi:hypothetical protein